MYSNTEEKKTTLNDEKTFVVAERSSEFEYSDSTIKDNIYVFEGKFQKNTEICQDCLLGSNNPLVMSRVYDVEWICEYDMRSKMKNNILYLSTVINISIFRWYPFDTQTCNMILSPDGNNGEFIDLQVNGLEYQGPMDLTQYFIRTTGISMLEDGSISVVVVLGRRLLGTLLTVYIPTMLLITISYSTNFFKPFFFEAVVAVNLTCMLVGGILQKIKIA